jgi:uncharacterized lipoprotein YajG
MKKSLIALITSIIAAIGLTGCDGSNQTANSEPTQSAAPMEGMAAATESSPVAPTSSDLASILAAQPEAVIARYPSRNPQQTLEFFGIQPGMTVVEAPRKLG